MVQPYSTQQAWMCCGAGVTYVNGSFAIDEDRLKISKSKHGTQIIFLAGRQHSRHNIALMAKYGFNKVAQSRGQTGKTIHTYIRINKPIAADQGRYMLEALNNALGGA